mmetsp:Transcript_2430/g.6688  ORF Transcript_2430/g.6688 Transcript_2430/m.6688 type:complete len:208 (-) Transcript_2430:48-671(-)
MRTSKRSPKRSRKQHYSLVSFMKPRKRVMSKACSTSWTRATTQPYGTFDLVSACRMMCLRIVTLAMRSVNIELKILSNGIGRRHMFPRASLNKTRCSEKSANAKKTKEKKKKAEKARKERRKLEDAERVAVTADLLAASQGEDISLLSRYIAEAEQIGCDEAALNEARTKLGALKFEATDPQAIQRREREKRAAAAEARMKALTRAQ